MNGLRSMLAALGLLALMPAAGAATAAETSAGLAVDADGTVHIPAFAVPPSSYMSDTARQVYADAMRHPIQPIIDQGIVPRDQFEALFIKFVEGATEDRVIDVSGLEGAQKVAEPIFKPSSGGSFDLQLTADKSVYRQNDAAVLQIVSTRDCNLFVVNVDKSGTGLAIKLRDHRTGNEVPVDVKLGASDATRPGGIPTPTPTPRPTPDAPAPAPGTLTSKSFGITTEAATADLLPVVKVVSVTPGSPAGKAGIEVGDAITGVDDRIIFAPDLLDEALGKVGSTFTLTILDVKTGKKTPVKVDLSR